MSAVIPEGMEPLAVWDVRAAEWPRRCRNGTAEQMGQWIWQQLDAPPSTIYRIEFYLLDAPFGVIYRHQRNEDGRLHWNPETRRPYEEEPVIVPLAELPPAHLLKG